MRRNTSRMDVPTTSGERVATLLPELMGLLHCVIAGETLQIMHEAGLTMPQMVAMHVLRARGATAIGDLGSMLNLSTSATSHLVDRLVERAFVDRVEDAEDRRQKRLTLTDGARDLLDRLADARTKEL